MATGASNSDAAVILIDARKGVLTQTRRHSYICSLLGIRHVGARGQQDRPGRLLRRALPPHRRRLPRASRRRSASARSRPFRCRPATATTSRRARERMRWYDGPTLLEHLESLDVDRGLEDAAVPLPGAVGEPAEPRLPRLLGHRRLRRRSQPAIASSSRPPARSRRVARIVTADGDLPEARAGDAVTLDSRRRGRRRARRRARARRCPPGGRRSVRGARAVDERRSRCCPAARISCGSARSTCRRA